MSDTIKVEAIRNGQVNWENIVKAETPIVEVANTVDVANFSRLQTRMANACIYCGSTEQLSREHILAYALGGSTTIPRGSCEECRKITHGFETAVLRGPMQMVRYIQDMPSGTKHKDVPETIPVKVTVNGREMNIDAPKNEAPILLPFPIFDLPGYIDPGSPQLKLAGVVTGSFGADPKEFNIKHGAESLEVKVTGNDAVAFARMVAKTAYAFGHALDQLQRLKNKTDLIRAIMYEPNTIGRYVGTLPAPYKKSPDLQHRISIHVMSEHRLLYSIVQLFSNIGAPSYIVILGTLKDDDSMDDVG